MTILDISGYIYRFFWLKQVLDLWVRKKNQVGEALPDDEGFLKWWQKFKPTLR